MSKEHWIVKSNTKGLLYFPKLGLTFKERNQEKELCFLTGKTIDELEKDTDIAMHLSANNISTVSKERIKENNESLINEINELKKIIIDDQKANVQVLNPLQQIDIASLIEVIKNEIKSSLGSNNSPQQTEKIVSSSDNDDRAREDAIRQLIFKRKDTSVKNFEELGSEKQVSNEGEGNEDLLGDLGL